MRCFYCDKTLEGCYPVKQGKALCGGIVCGRKFKRDRGDYREAQRPQRKVIRKVVKTVFNDVLAGFRRCRKTIAGRPAGATTFKVLLSRLRRLQLMLSNPGWSL